MSVYFTGYMPWGSVELARYQHAWGETRRISTRHGELFLCRGQDGYSSRHYHTHHTNVIRVIDGCLDVEVDGKWYRLTHWQSVEIPPGRMHRLVLVEPSTFEEKYLGPQDAPDPRDDIVRMDTGSSEHWRP